jgi:hypothetical protein
MVDEFQTRNDLEENGNAGTEVLSRNPHRGIEENRRNPQSR